MKEVKLADCGAKLVSRNPRSTVLIEVTTAGSDALWVESKNFQLIAPENSTQRASEFNLCLLRRDLPAVIDFLQATLKESEDV